ILSKTLGTTIFSLTLVFGLGVLAASASPADTLQPASTITYNEEVVVNDTIRVDSAYIGKQGTGGVTFFNGTIINTTTGDNNANNPVTFGDDVRIDGEIYRTEKGGDNAIKISDHVIPTQTTTNNFGTDANRWNSVYAKDGNFSGTLTVATLVPTTLSGTGIVTSTNIADGAVAAADLADSAITSAKIADGTIATADIADSAVTSAKIANTTIASGDLADSAVTSAKIADETVATADLADGSVTPAKINGTGGANLPIAYAVVNGNADTIMAGTSNVTGVTSGAPGQYKISFSGLSYDHDNHVTVITPLISGGLYDIVYAHDGSGNLDVYTYNSATGLASDVSFSFVIYQP
ncbi:hypothetical protein KJ903_01125, partial [Patescibacteria group bacterium]|nr:hypothetical protein [Patescibacteria group bacterium]